MNAPEFSIVVPTHNRPDGLRRAIASLLAQTFGAYEIIVVDDGSHLPALEVLAAVGDQRLRIIRHDVALGVSAARNRGVAEAQGRHVTFLDDDDIYLPTYLAAARRAFAETLGGAPGFIWCHRYAVLEPDMQAFIARTPAPTDLGSTPYTPRADLYDMHIGCGHGLSVTRDLLVASGGFDVRLAFAEDYDLLLRLLSMGARVAHLNAMLMACAFHRSGGLTTNSNVRNRTYGLLSILRKNREFLAGRSGAEAYMLRLISRDMVHHGLSHRGFRLIHYARRLGGDRKWTRKAIINSYFHALKCLLAGRPIPL